MYEPDIIFMCLEDDSQNITSAFHINTIPQITLKPIVINISEDEGFALTIRAQVNSLLEKNKVFMFPAIKESCTKEIIMRERMDSIAKAIHDFSYKERAGRAKGYMKAMAGKKKGTAEFKSLKAKYDQIMKNDSFVTWDDLSEIYKDSNRLQAEHIPIKLKALGYELVDEEEFKKGKYKPITTIKDPKDRLAKMEHLRWNADRFMAGWKYDKIKTDKTSPYLVEWEKLSEEIKQYDRDAVVRIPKILALARPRQYIVKT
jgi:hypothetical protein